MAYNCRNCQADPTCVVCRDCFLGGNHDGHDVTYHRTSQGSYCDCGDTEAWAVEGMCDKHRPSEMLPESVLLEEIASEPNLASMLTPLLKTCMALLVETSKDLRQAFNIEAIPGPWESGDWDVVLHNDDVHTYDDVIYAIHTITGSSQPVAAVLTEKVDKEGEAVTVSKPFAEALDCAKKFRQRELLVSLQSLSLKKKKLLALEISKWLNGLADKSDSLALLVAFVLLGRDRLPGEATSADKSESKDDTVAPAGLPPLFQLISNCARIWKAMGIELNKLYLKLLK